MYVNNLSESKYEYFMKNCKNVGIKHLNDSNAYIECSNTMDDVHDTFISQAKKEKF